MLNQLVKKMQDIQTLSHKMLMLAKSGDWEQLPELEQLRDKKIRMFFEEQEISVQDSDKIGQAIQSILTINNKIALFAEQEKIAVCEQIQGIKKRQNVNSAYLQNK